MNPVHATERHLLLVDDEENVLRSLQRVLRRDGYRVHLANSVEKAFELLGQFPIDVVLSDQRMPAQNGTEFLGKVKDLYPATVRLMLSGYTEVTAVTDAINEGAIYKFLTKPWDDDHLRANVREAFQRRDIESENSRLHRQVEEINTELMQLNHVLEQELQDRNLRIERDTSVVCVMQEIIDYLPLGVVGVDNAAEVVSMNTWAASLFDEAMVAFIGQPVSNLPSPMPDLVHDYLFGFDLSPQRHVISLNGLPLVVDIQPMGIRSDSSGCLVLIQLKANAS